MKEYLLLLRGGKPMASKTEAENKAELQAYREMGETAYVASKKDLSLKFVREYPREFVVLTLKRFGVFWSGEAAKYDRDVFYWEAPFFGWLSALAWLGFLLIIFKQRPAGLLLSGIALLYPAVYYITYSQPRYRYAIEPILVLGAVYFETAVASHWRSRSAGSRMERAGSAAR